MSTLFGSALGLVPYLCQCPLRSPFNLVLVLPRSWTVLDEGFILTLPPLRPTHSLLFFLIHLLLTYCTYLIYNTLRPVPISALLLLHLQSSTNFQTSIIESVNHPSFVHRLSTARTGQTPLAPSVASLPNTSTAGASLRTRPATEVPTPAPRKSSPPWDWGEGTIAPTPPRLDQVQAHPCHHSLAVRPHPSPPGYFVR